MFHKKIELIVMYLNRLLENTSLHLGERFVYLCDQCYIKLQFFSGDPGDQLTQEVKVSLLGTGLGINHTLVENGSCFIPGVFIDARLPEMGGPLVSFVIQCSI